MTLTFTALTDALTNCHRTVPTLSHGIAVCPTCGAVVADLAYELHRSGCGVNNYNIDPCDCDGPQVLAALARVETLFAEWSGRQTNDDTHAMYEELRAALRGDDA